MSPRTQAWNQSRAYVACTARDEDALTSLMHDAVRDDPTPIVNTSRELKWIRSDAWFLRSVKGTLV